MRGAIPTLAITAAMACLLSCGGGGSTVVVEPDGQGAGSAGPSGLQMALEGRAGPLTLELRPGHYHLEPGAWSDPSCGNCEDPATPVQATVGLRVSGEQIRIVGTAAEEVVIHTGAGYGILFDGCRDCSLEGVTVTDGARDPDGNATDAAVVVRDATVRIARCRLRDNLGDPETVRSTVVGIMGIAGREGAELTIEGNRIVRNSWDGIALYRGATALIRDNVVDGVDSATGETIGGGRGVAVGLTWDSRATVEGNLLARYWKGLGIFVDARADASENIIEDMVTWGIAYWDAGKGRPVARLRDNAVYGAGACGVSIAREIAGEPEPGFFTGNAVVSSGRNEKYDAPDYYCTQEALAEGAVPEGFLMDGNLFFHNRRAGGEPEVRDLEEAEFRQQVAPLIERLRGRPALADSSFLADFGG